ncbi:MAG: thioesterase family protein, partial [Actinomycetota bacterium]
MTFRFDEATRVHANGDDTFSARVHDGWDIGGNANGGYLLALVSAAMCKATGRSLPVAISCHYLGPVNDADVVIETRVVKTGKAFATAHATMRHGDRVVVTAIGTCGNALPPGARRHVTQEKANLPDFAFGPVAPRGTANAKSGRFAISCVTCRRAPGGSALPHVPIAVTTTRSPCRIVACAVAKA